MPEKKNMWSSEHMAATAWLDMVGYDIIGISFAYECPVWQIFLEHLDSMPGSCIYRLKLWPTQQVLRAPTSAWTDWDLFNALVWGQAHRFRVPELVMSFASRERSDKWSDQCSSASRLVCPGGVLSSNLMDWFEGIWWKVPSVRTTWGYDREAKPRNSQAWHPA